MQRIPRKYQEWLPLEQNNLNLVEMLIQALQFIKFALCKPLLPRNISIHLSLISVVPR
jgi:hypothetical protein